MIFENGACPMSLIARRTLLTAALALPIAACARKPEPEAPVPAGRAALEPLIKKYARLYDMPESLIHRVIQRESDYNPGARNGPYYGLMQILPQTARQMGHQGPPEALLNAETNLKYAGKYLRGAWMVSGGNEQRAVMWYARGYYYEAKRQGLLEETGLRS